MKSQIVSIDRIVIPEFVERESDHVADDRDRQSIKEHGIEQDLVLVPDGDRLLLCDGLRRIRISRALGNGKVPYVTSKPPRGVDAEAYVRDLRLALHTHFAPLTPSQKCEFVITLKKRLGMNNLLIAKRIGVNQDTITNWLDLKTYIPEVVAAMDAGAVAQRTARVFSGMSEEGQRFIWKKHGSELLGRGKSDAHKRYRALYPPEKHPEFYRNAENISNRLARKAQKRKAVASITPEEKRRLMSSFELKEIELSSGAREKKHVKAEIAASIQLVYTIMRSERLKAMAEKIVPGCLEEFERFCEVY